MTDNPRQALTPQLAAYDQLGMDWRAYLMFFHPANYRSKPLNTDSFGLRYSSRASGRFSPFEPSAEARQQAVIIGGSTVFGVGASTDGHTIASALSQNSDCDWFNLGARAFNGTQELILFTKLAPTLGPLKQVILFSGLNDLMLPVYVSPFDEVLGAFYYNAQFRQAMAELQPISRKRALLRHWLAPLAEGDVNFRTAPMKELLGLLFGNQPAVAAPDASARLAQAVPRALKQAEQNLQVWAALQKQLGFEFQYVLQPNANWCKPQLSSEELALFDWLDRSAPAATAAIIKSLDREIYQQYRDGLGNICQKLEIKFSDSNETIRDSAESNSWLFIDRAHLTDHGNALIARQLQKPI